ELYAGDERLELPAAALDLDPHEVGRPWLYLPVVEQVDRDRQPLVGRHQLAVGGRPAVGGSDVEAAHDLVLAAVVVAVAQPDQQRVLGPEHAAARERLAHHARVDLQLERVVVGHVTGDRLLYERLAVADRALAVQQDRETTVDVLEVDLPEDAVLLAAAADLPAVEALPEVAVPDQVAGGVVRRDRIAAGRDGRPLAPQHLDGPLLAGQAGRALPHRQVGAAGADLDPVAALAQDQPAVRRLDLEAALERRRHGHVHADVAAELRQHEDRAVVGVRRGAELPDLDGRVRPEGDVRAVGQLYQRLAVLVGADAVAVLQPLTLRGDGLAHDLLGLVQDRALDDVVERGGSGRERRLAVPADAEDQPGADDDEERERR